MLSGGGPGRGDCFEFTVRASAADRSASPGPRHVVRVVAFAFRHPPYRGAHSGSHCGGDGMLSGGACLGAPGVAPDLLGATVMPHNLYLHSALVQTRRIGHTIAERREACRFNLVDSVIALNGALIVNGAILVLAAAVFFKQHIVVTEIAQAQLLLSPLLDRKEHTSELQSRL